jgi:hypothetical protein
MAVALVVLVGSLSSVLIGGRIAERRTAEERLARNQIERLIAGVTTCPIPVCSMNVDGVAYTIRTTRDPLPNYVEFGVTVSARSDPSGTSVTLAVDTLTPSP